MPASRAVPGDIPVGEGVYLAQVGEGVAEDLLDHSCDPNSGFLSNYVIAARRRIAPGEEITVDYAMTETYEHWSMPCSCGTACCRGTITGNDWKSPDIQRKYAGWMTTHVRERVRKGRRSYLSPKVRRGPCALGQGLLAAAPIRKDEVLLDLRDGPGKVIGAVEAARLRDAGCRFMIQVDEDRWLAAVDGPEDGDCINHSCDPTAGLRGSLVFVARRDIAPGEEISFDYATAESRPTFEMACSCGAALCRKVVRGTDWQDPVLQRRHAGYWSDYIQRKLDRPWPERLLRRLLARLRR